jgi:hypothetical protein
MSRITQKQIEDRFTTLKRLVNEYLGIEIELKSQALETTKYHIEKVSNGTWFPTERSWNGNKAFYEAMGYFLQILWLIPKIHIDKDIQVKMLKAYQEEDSIFLGDTISGYLPFLHEKESADTQTKQAVKDQINEGQYYE